MPKIDPKKRKDGKDQPMEVEFGETNVQFLEDGNYIDMTVTEAEDKEFPPNSESESEGKDNMEEINTNDNSRTNKIVDGGMSAVRSSGTTDVCATASKPQGCIHG